MHYIPLAVPFFFALFLFYVSVLVLIELRILRYTYEKVGVDRRYVFSLLLLSLLEATSIFPSSNCRQSSWSRPGSWTFSACSM